MTAGEAVFQGREGTGLAQILNWRQYQPDRQNFFGNPAQLLRLQQQQRMADDRKIADYMKIGDGAKWFNEKHQRDISELNAEIARDLDIGLSADEAINRHRDKADRIRVQVKKGLSAEETHRRKLDELKKQDNIDLSRAVPFLNDALFPMKDKDGNLDFDQIDENLAQQIDAHPSIFDARKSVLGTASRLRQQLESGEITDEVLRGNNQDFFVRENNKYRFKVDPQTGKISSDVINLFANDPKVFDRILWDNIAKENGVFDDNRILPEERNAIDEIFNRERLNPKNAEKVYGQVESWLNAIQQEATRTDLINKGRDFRPPSDGGFGNLPDAVQVSKGNMRVRDLSTAETTGVMGSRGGEISLRIPEFAKLRGIDERRPGVEMEFLKMELNPETGKKDAVFVDQYGTEVKTEATPRIMSILNNTKKTAQSNQVYKNFLKQADKLSAEEVYFDKPTFDKDILELTDLIYTEGQAVGRLRQEEPQQRFVEKLSDWLGKRGVKAEIVFKRNWWNPDITINGQMFDTAKPADVERLKKHIYGLTKDYYATDKKTNLQNPNLTQPKPGDEMDGYRFKGGDPAKPESWEKIK